MKIDWNGGISTAGAIVAILTAILGALIWIGSLVWNTAGTLKELQMTEILLQQQLNNNTQAIKEESAKREEDEQNMNRTMLIIAAQHNRRYR